MEASGLRVQIIEAIKGMSKLVDKSLSCLGIASHADWVASQEVVSALTPSA